MIKLLSNIVKDHTFFFSVDEDFEERVQAHTNIFILVIDIVNSNLQKCYNKCLTNCDH